MIPESEQGFQESEEISPPGRDIEDAEGVIHIYDRKGQYVCCSIWVRSSGWAIFPQTSGHPVGMGFEFIDRLRNVIDGRTYKEILAYSDQGRLTV